MAHLPQQTISERIDDVVLLLEVLKKWDCQKSSSNICHVIGHSKDDPNLPQVKLMMGMIDPLGMPLVTQVVSGEQADDGLYIPAYQQIAATLNKKATVLKVNPCIQNNQ